MAEKQHYTGLTDAQVAESREKHGVNILTPAEKDPLWKRFLEKFSDPLIIKRMSPEENTFVMESITYCCTSGLDRSKRR